MSENITPRQSLALAALLSGGTIEAAAAAAKVSPRTVYSWMQSADFRAALDAAQNDVARQAARQLANLLAEGADELSKMLKDSSLSRPEKLKVITVILQHYPRIHASVVIGDLSDRLDQLEELLKDDG
jgi:predicted NBD/HSP70 family sugar kinase